MGDVFILVAPTKILKTKIAVLCHGPYLFQIVFFSIKHGSLEPYQAESRDNHPEVPLKVRERVLF